MLAYVFWHAPRPDAVDYIDRLERFHRELARERPKGFVRTEVVEFPSLPWLSGTPVYEAWYQLESSAAMDIINDAAVTPPLQTSHDAVARDAMAGTAGVYRLRSGGPSAREVVWNHWFAKPEGMRYAALYEALEHLTRRAGIQLWSRYMVLGPTPEFCIRASEELDLPPGFTALRMRGKVF